MGDKLGNSGGKWKRPALGKIEKTKQFLSPVLKRNVMNPMLQDQDLIVVQNKLYGLAAAKDKENMIAIESSKEQGMKFFFIILTLVIL